MKFIYLIIFLLLLRNPLIGQPDHIMRLEKEVYVLNNALKYAESQSLIQQFISNEAHTDEDKYYAYLFLSFTYKRLFDYDKNLEYLETALSFGKKTGKKEYFEANIQCEKEFSLFDIQKYEAADSLMKRLSSTDYKYLGDGNKAKIIMQEGYLLFIAKKYKEAESKYNAALIYLRRTSICDLPMVLAKKIELYSAMHNDDAMLNAYQESMHHSDSCGIIKYSIYNKEMLVKALANRYGYDNLGSELDSLNKLFNRKENLEELDDLDTKYQMSIKDLEIANQKKNNLYLFLIVALLLFGLILLALFYFLLIKQKKLISGQYEYNEQLISMLSHDIKEPLLGVRLMLKKITMEEGPYVQVSRSLENQIDAVNSVLNNLLSLRKSNGLSVAKQNISNVNTVLASVIKILKNDLENKNILIDNKIDDDVILPIQEGKLHVVLYNLLQNAVKYSFPNSTIEMYTQNNSIFISDSGTGIDNEIINQLMKDVIKSKDGTLQEKGSGLGLFLIGSALKDEDVQVVYHRKNGQGTLVSVEAIN